MRVFHPILVQLPFIPILFFVVSEQPLLSQCTNGTEPECACKTAPVLCTIDELDGYTFSMAAHQHPNDGPTPICPGANGSQTNNPTWFAFTAWCTNLSLRVHSTNCHQVGGAVGFQLAIYTNCNFNHTVACNADITDCNTNDKILNLTGLNIGAVYYFMVDGCLGSYCTVSIDIIGVCGQEEIAPWTQPVTGNLDPCIGNTELYIVEDLDGARFYHWFVDGVSVGQAATDSFNILWTTPGTYQLCIDASNDPCVPITDPPLPLCTTITVHTSDAGVLNVTPVILCPHDNSQISSSGFTTGSDNAQLILITDAKGTILNVINAASGNFSSDSSGVFTIYAYNYVTTGGTIPVIGSHISDLDCGSACCDLESQSITFQSIQAIVTDILCDDNGTGNDSTDDIFTFNVLVTGSNVGTLWRSSDGTITGTYGTPQNCGPYLIRAGALAFDLHDNDVPTCFTSIMVDPPLACSSCLQTIDAGSGSILNCINTLAILSGTCSEAGTYQWTGPNLFSSQTLVSTVSDSGWYYLNIGFPNHCTSIDSVYIDLDNETPVPDAGPDQLIDCNHPDVLIDASGSTGNNLQFTWKNLSGAVISTQSLIMVSLPGKYVLQVSNSITGCSAIDTVEVIKRQNELSQVSSIILPESCIGDNNGMIEVIGTIGGIPPFSYSLNSFPGNSSGQFDNLAPGNYDLEIMDGYGCIIDTFFTINQGIDLQVTLPDTIKVKEDQASSIHAIVNVPVTDLSSILWSPSGILSCDTCLSPFITTSVNQTLQLTVTHENGCVSTTDVYLLVIPSPNIYIPNTFTPNGDGLNDYFIINVNTGVKSVLELNIFDRWGEHIFGSQNSILNTPGAGWDGKFHQKDMPSGVYAYYIKLLLADGSEKTIVGDITLVR